MKTNITKLAMQQFGQIVFYASQCQQIDLTELKTLLDTVATNEETLKKLIFTALLGYKQVHGHSAPKEEVWWDPIFWMDLEVL